MLRGEGEYMKKSFFVFILILSAIICAYGQNASPIDLVLLLDTSTGMSSSYDNVSDYITGSFLNEYLRVGDTFHLITFSGNQKLDAARRILGVGDVETIIGRMLTQYPVETGSNVTAALTFAERYVTFLPSRAKKIVLITTGATDTTNLVTASKQRLNSRNTTLDYIQVTPGKPLTNLPKSGRPVVKPTPVKTTSTTTSTANTKSTSSGSAVNTTSNNKTNAGSDTGTGSSTSSVASTNTTSGANTTSGTSTTSGTNTVSGTESTAKTDAISTTGTGQGASDSSGSNSSQTSNTASGTNDTSGSSNQTGAQSSTYNNSKTKKDNNESFFSSLPFIILVIILALLILGLIIYFATRNLSSSPKRVMAEAADSTSKDTRFKDHSKDLANYAAGKSRRSTPYEDRPIKNDSNQKAVINPSGPLLLNLFVIDQNKLIGKRNIHSLKSGYSLSVGGGKNDDYLIFLVPMPPHLGEIRRDGSTLTFTPKKPKYFPEIGSNEVKDCINKTIKIVSDKNYEMRFMFEMYEDPLDTLNRTLMSVKVPG